jgi:hypothetical protein
VRVREGARLAIGIALLFGGRGLCGLIEQARRAGQGRLARPLPDAATRDEPPAV